MARRFNVTLAPFGCTGCGEILGWTSPGEAKRMGSRANVYCENCRNTPELLTDRQKDLLATLVQMNEEGLRPSITIASDRMGISRSRGQQLATSIRARGFAERLEEAMTPRLIFDTPQVTSAVDTPEAVAEVTQPEPAPVIAPVPPAPVPVSHVLADDTEEDWYVQQTDEGAPIERTPSVAPARIGTTVPQNPEQDPATTAVEFL